MAIRVLVWSACLMAFLSAGECLAGPETLDSLIKAALKNNREIAAAENRYQSMRSEADAAGTLPDPQITLSAMDLPRTTLSFKEMEMSGFGIGFSQTIPWPKKLSAESRIAKSLAEMESSSARGKRNSIVRQLKQSYYEFSYWSFVENLQDETIQLSQNILEYIQNRYSSGTSSLEEVISARVSKGEMENEKIDIVAKKQTALFMLRQLVNDTAMADSTLSPYLSMNLEDLQPDSTDPGKNPSLTGAAVKYEEAKAKHSLAKSEYWPELMVGADYLIRIYDTSHVAAGHQFPGEDLVSFHLGFTVPLWFFAKQNKMTRAAKYEMEMARAEQQSTQIQINQSIKDAQNQQQALRKRIKHFVEDIIPLSDAAYNAAFVAYEVGQIDFQSLLEDQLDLYHSKLAHIELVKEYHQISAYLDELAGKEYGEKTNEKVTPVTTHN